MAEWGEIIRGTVLLLGGGGLGAWWTTYLQTKAQAKTKRLELAVQLAQADIDTRIRAADAAGGSVELVPAPVNVEYMHRCLDLSEKGELNPERLREVNDSMLPLMKEVERFSRARS